jgi:hypothetical protein
VASRHSHMVAESSHRREDALEGAPEGGQPMKGIGLDLHKRESQLCILTDAERSSGFGS